MAGVKVKIGKGLTIIEAGYWVNGGSLYSFLNLCICLKCSLIKKFLKGCGERTQIQPEYKTKCPSLSTLYWDTEKSGKSSDSERQPRGFVHSQSRNYIF